MGETSSATKEQNPGKLKARELFTWSASGFSNTMNLMALSFLTIYCTDMLGLNAALVGTLLLASRVLDGVTDVFAGYLVDKTNTKMGRGRPYEFCIIGVWVCTVLLFSCPVGWEIPVKCIWILVMYAFVNSIFRTLLAAGTTPYMVRAFNNQQKYVSLTSYGGLISMLGAVVINVAFPIMMGSLATSPQGWTTMILIIAVPGTLLGMLRFFFVPEKYDVDAKTEKINFKDVLTVLKTNKYIYAVGFMMLVYQMVMNMGVSVYYYTYVVKNIELLSVTGMLTIVMVPVMFIFPPLLKRFNLRDVIFVGFLMCVVGGVVNWFANDNFWLLMLGVAINGIGVVPISMLNGLMIVECADYNEWKGMHRMEATLGVIPNLASKLGGAFGAFLLGIFLELGKYVSATGGEVIEQPDSAIFMLRLLLSFIPLGFYALAALAARMYNLGKLMPQIRKENEERRALKAQS